MNSGSI